MKPLIPKGQDGTAMGKPPKGHNSSSLSMSVAKVKCFSKVIDLLKSAELGEKNVKETSYLGRLLAILVFSWAAGNIICSTLLMLFQPFHFRLNLEPKKWRLTKKHVHVLPSVCIRTHTHMGVSEQAGAFWALGFVLYCKGRSPDEFGSHRISVLKQNFITLVRSLFCICAFNLVKITGIGDHRNRSFQHRAYMSFWSAVLPWDWQTDHPARRWQAKVTPSLFSAFLSTSSF